MGKEKWILSPICKNKTRLRIKKDTEIKIFSLYCPECKREVIINVKNFQTIVIAETAYYTGLCKEGGRREGACIYFENLGYVKFLKFYEKSTCIFNQVHI